jgi:hypothetical protein
MAKSVREVVGTNVVLLGSFNPAIFQPAWFAKQGLLSTEEAEGAEINLVHPELVSFTAGWLELQVTQSQFLAATTQDPLEALRDLVLGTFSLLSFTPITKMGINRDVHVRMPDESTWHGVGHTLVPPSNWTFLEKPGLRTLIEEGQRPDEQTGFIRIKVEPSNLVQPGVYIQINDHYQWDVPEGETAVDQVLKLLKDGWSSSLDRADTFTNEVVRVGGMPT